MAEWLYLASQANGRASLADTLAAAVGRNVVWRGSRNAGGRLIANVPHLQPGDTLVLGFRQPLLRAYLRARIGEPKNPAEGTAAVDVVGHPHSDELEAVGYPVEHGVTEVIHLEDVEECCFDLVGRYVPNQQAIWRMDGEPKDAAAVQSGGPLDIPDLPSRPVVPRGAPPTVTAVPPRIVPRASPATRCFDAYVMIDWSASRSRAAPNAADSVWAGIGEWNGDQFVLGTPQHHPTRFGARAWLDAQLLKWVAEKRRVLVGFDFAFGYPKGFAAALGNASGGWTEVHRHLLSVKDDPQNKHDGARFAADCNARLAPSGPGPFWGCGAGDVVQGILTRRRVGIFTFPYGPQRLEEWRITDLRARRFALTQSVWKLNCGVSVGMQTIVGIRHLARTTPPSSEAPARRRRSWPG